MDPPSRLGTDDAQLEANLIPREFQSRFSICIFLDCIKSIEFLL